MLERPPTWNLKLIRRGLFYFFMNSVMCVYLLLFCFSGHHLYSRSDPLFSLDKFIFHISNILDTSKFSRHCWTRESWIQCHAKKDLIILPQTFLFSSPSVPSLLSLLKLPKLNVSPLWHCSLLATCMHSSSSWCCCHFPFLTLEPILLSLAARWLALDVTFVKQELRLADSFLFIHDWENLDLDFWNWNWLWK